MYTQINNFMENKLSVFLAGFRKNHNTQRCLVSMIENWKDTLNKGEFVAAKFIDLSNIFGTMSRYLMITKLGAYGFRKDLLTYLKKLFK